MKNTMKKMLAVVLVLVMCASVAMPVFAATPKCPGDATMQHTKANCDAEAVAGGKHDPTCQKQGYTLYQCKGCEKYFADDIVDPLGGAEGQCDWEVVTPATCATPGKQVCKRCGAEEEISTSTVAHQYEWDIDATCGFPGVERTGICKVCKHKTTEDLTDHVFPTTPTIDVYPKCGEVEGKAHYTCTREGCGYKKEVVIYALDYHMDLVDLTKELKDATCGADGLKIKDGYTKAEKCTVCGYNTTEVVNAQHSWGAEYTLAPTCTTYGFVFRGCTLCGATETVKVIDKAGHNYVPSKANPTCGEDVTLTCDWSQYVCDKTNCVVNGQHTLHPTTGCKHTEELKGKECDYEEKSTAATCVAPGYKWEVCKVCGTEKANSRVQTEPATGKHTWNEEPEMNASTDPTCQHTGVYTYLCVNDGCLAFTQVPKAKLEHKYGEGETTQPLCGVDGYITYTCTQPGCIDPDTGKPHQKVEKPDSLKFDPSKAAHHGDLAAGIAAGTISTTKNEVNPITGLPYPNTDAACGVASITTYKCATCTAKNPVDANGKQAWVTFAVVGELKAHWNPTITTPEDLPTHCGDTGVTEGWSCAACNKSVASVAVKASKTEHNYVVTNENKTLSCSNPLNYECDCTFDIVDANGNVYKKDVECGATDTKTCDGVATTPADQRNNDCEVWGYQHFECAKCGEGYIDNFEYATGHNMVEDTTKYKPAKCVEDGEKVYNCDNVHTNYDGTQVPCTVKDNTIETIPAIGHLDKDGNVILCTDANGNPITENVLCFRKEADGGCCTCAADATCEGHSVAWKPLHNWVDTTVDATCVHYKYILHVCETCQYDYTETIFVKADHNFTGAFNADGTPNFNNSGWKVTSGKEATYAQAGEKYFKCLTDGCNEKKTAPYTLTDIKFTLKTDSGIKTGADIVNSGKLLVTIEASAYDIDLYSIDLQVKYDTSKYTYKGFTVSDYTKALIGESGVEVGNATAGLVGIYMANNGKTPTNVSLDKVANKALITLEFDVKADACVATTGTTTGKVWIETASVLKATGTDKVTSNISSASNTVTIQTLGNVTMGTIESSKKLVDDYDARKLVEIMRTANGYSATADINKDGVVNGDDYRALAKYIADGCTYVELCATTK